jgi:hypothetical protein
MDNGKNRSLKKILKKTLKIIMVFASVVFFFLLVITGILLYYSPGKPSPYRDKEGNIPDGGISERYF